MEYQKIENLIDDVSNQQSKFTTKNWVEINDESRGACNSNNQIKFKTTMLKSSLRDYSDAYILVKGKTTITRAGDDADARHTDEINKGVIFKNFAPYSSCIREINDTQVGNAKDIDSDNYSKISGSLWKYYRDEPNDNVTDSESFKSKIEITGKSLAAGNEKHVEIIVPVKYLGNFWRTLEMPLINCEVNLILTWSLTCVVTGSTCARTFAIKGTKLYVLVVTLSTQYNAKLRLQLKSGFKRVISWNKYLSKRESLRQNVYLNHLVEPSFQEINRLFVLSFESDTQRISHSRYYLQNAELKD